MRSERVVGTEMAMALIFLLGLYPPASAEDRGIAWFNNLDMAREAAQKTNRPMMIDFWADWCEPCKIMDREVYTDPTLIAAAGQRIVAVRIHFDLQPEMARKYDVPALPYLVFTNSYGTELMHHRGFLEANDLGAVLRAMPADVSELNRLDHILQGDKDDRQALRDMGRQLRAGGFFESSNDYFRKVLKAEQARSEPVQIESILFEMGLNSLELRDGKQAVPTFERCLNEFPRSARRADFLLGLGKAYSLDGKKDKARKSLNSLIVEYPQSRAAQEARELLTPQ